MAVYKLNLYKFIQFCVVYIVRVG